MVGCIRILRSGDILLAESVRTGALAAQARHTATVAVSVPLSASGAGYFLVVADAASQVNEAGAEANNNAAAPVLAIVSIVLGLKNARRAHRAVSRYTFPIWMYVSVTGVVIYVMLYKIWPPHSPLS